MNLSQVQFKTLWSGSFLDGTLTLSKDPTDDALIYFTLTDSIDVEFQGFMPIPTQFKYNPSNAIESILGYINEQYCILQLQLYNTYIQKGGKLH